MSDCSDRLEGAYDRLYALLAKGDGMCSLELEAEIIRTRKEVAALESEVAQEVRRELDKTVEIPPSLLEKLLLEVR